MKFTCKNEDDLKEVAQELMKRAEQYRKNAANNDRAFIVGLNGDLGSGKTTFTKTLMRQLNVSEEVTSPTFVIQKNFDIDFAGYKKVAHFDAYRLNSGEELKVLDFDQLSSDPENIILIEWSEIVADILPEDTLNIKFTFIDETTREIEFE
jgi:tRNA threonylcarbamoyladenosine biosynthesis protein TsaE